MKAGSGNKEITHICSTKQNPRKGNLGSVPQVGSRDSMDHTQVYTSTASLEKLELQQIDGKITGRIHHLLVEVFPRHLKFSLY